MISPYIVSGIILNIHVLFSTTIQVNCGTELNLYFANIHFNQWLQMMLVFYYLCWTASFFLEYAWRCHILMRRWKVLCLISDVMDMRSLIVGILQTICYYQSCFPRFVISISLCCICVFTDAKSKRQKREI